LVQVEELLNRPNLVGTRPGNAFGWNDRGEMNIFVHNETKERPRVAGARRKPKQDIKTFHATPN
jgi:hypothetical protein